MNGSSAIIWPAIALVALTYAVWFIMYGQRFGLMKRIPPRPEDFATNEAAMRYFEPVEMSAANLRNLFEMPVLFLALLPLLLITGLDNDIQVVLAWVYVGLRLVHSFIHVGRRKVMIRFLTYAASCAVLLAMWIGFAIDLSAA